MTTARLASDWHRVGAGLSVRFEMRPGMIEAEWSPRPPTKRELKRVIGAYRAARGAFLHEVSSGRSVLVVEVGA